MYTFMNTNMTMFHGLTMFIFWLIIFYLIFSLGKKDKVTSLEILKKRLAKGEITKEEFESLKATLKEDL